MEKIDKFIAKLHKKVAHALLGTLYCIRLNDLNGLDIKKLRGRSHEYRVRIGRVRIQFLKTDNGNIITDVNFKGDNTY